MKTNGSYTQDRQVEAGLSNYVFGKVMPSATDLEQAVIGAMLVDRDSVPEIMDLLRPESFYAIQNREIFIAIRSLHSRQEPVDILTGGFPCQDLSLAGKRAGLKDGTRSGLWSEFAHAIDVIRPRLVVIENVRGLLSATAHSDVEPCSWCLGDDGGEPALRALGAVLGDLASLGYDARWTGLRAADAGAPHGRFRVFIVAYPRNVNAEDSIGH